MLARCNHVRVFDVIRSALLDALAVVLPVECAGCGAPDRSVCARCAGVLEPAVVPRSTPHGIRCFTALRYEGEVRSIVLAFKEENRTDLARPLSRALAPALLAALAAAGSAELLAVPSSPAAFRRRGYDPVRALLAAASYRSRPGLAVVLGTVQKTLGIAGRAANRAGSMAALRRLDGRRFVLVDDVITTGATLDEAARAVTHAGGEVAASAALAFTPRLNPPLHESPVGKR